MFFLIYKVNQYYKNQTCMFFRAKMNAITIIVCCALALGATAHRNFCNVQRDDQSLSLTALLNRDFLWSFDRDHLDFGNKMTFAELKHDTSEAIRFWTSLCDLNITYTDNKNEAFLVIGFYRNIHGDPFHFDGPGGITAHAFYPESSFSGHIHIDADEIWIGHTKILENQESEGTSYYAVMAHEIGHTLGLDHSQDSSSVLFPGYMGGVYATKIYADKALKEQLLSMYGEPPTPRDFKYKPFDYEAAATTEMPTTTTLSTTTTRKNGLCPCSCLRSTTGQTQDINTDIVTRGNDTYTAKSVVLGDRLFVFFGKFVWGYSFNNRQIQMKNPTDLNLIYGFDKYVTNVDYVYESGKDRVSMVVGSNLWKFNNKNKRVISGYPKRLTDLGLPSTLPEGTQFTSDLRTSRTYIRLPTGGVYIYDELSNTMVGTVGEWKVSQ